MNYEELRVSKLKNYLLEVVEEINSSIKKININALSKDTNSYSLDKMPTSSTIESFIDGTQICRDVFSFRNRVVFSYNEIDNLKNIGFFEKFEALIEDRNKKGILPEIDNIESIECLNCGALSRADTGTAIFDIQIQITYLKK